MALNSPTSARTGDPAAHRRLAGPFAARRLDAVLARLDGEGPWRPLVALGGEPSTSLDLVVTGAALCAVEDLDAAVALLRRVLVPGGRLVFLEHVGGAGVLGGMQRASDRLYATWPAGCHVCHDVHAGLKR